MIAIDDNKKKKQERKKFNGRFSVRIKLVVNKICEECGHYNDKSICNRYREHVNNVRNCVRKIVGGNK